MTDHTHDHDEGMEGLRLTLTHQDMPLMDLLVPDVITSVKFDESNFAYEITMDDGVDYNDNFYYVFGKLSGFTKSIPMAMGQIHDELVKETLKHNYTVLSKLVRDIYETCEEHFPKAIVANMRAVHNHSIN